MKIEDLKAAERKYWFGTFAGMAPSMVLLIFNTEISRWLSTALEVADIGIKAPVIGLATLSVTLVLIFVAIFAGQRFFLSRCPSCRKTILPNASGIVIATKNCPNCGERVIDETGRP